MNIDKIIKKGLSKGAKPKLQSQWKNFKPNIKKQLRKKYKDSDKDGVPNRWDCQPYNKWKKDTRPNILMKQKFQQLPIYYYTGESRGKEMNYTYPMENPLEKGEEYNQPMEQRKDVIHFSESPKPVRQEVYKTLKRHPHLISEFEKSKGEVLLIDKSKSGDEISQGYNYPFINPDTGKIGKSKIIAFKEFNRDKSPLYADDSAKVLFHELKHSQQALGQTSKEYMEEKSNIKKLKKLEAPQFDVESEKEAYQYHLQKLGERVSEKESDLYKREHELNRQLYIRYMKGEINKEQWENELNNLRDEYLKQR